MQTAYEDDAEREARLSSQPPIKADPCPVCGVDERVGCRRCLVAHRCDHDNTLCGRLEPLNK